MKFCPMCGTSQSKSGLTVCEFCDYEEKEIDALSEQELCDLMAPYNYERIADGVRIKSVKNDRMRGTVAIPHVVTEISTEAFAGCKFLTRIALPNRLRSIGAGAFSHCRDLFDVFIPVGVNHVGKGAFADCYDLGVICAAAPAQPDGWDSDWLSDCSAKVEWSSIDEA